MSTCRFTTSTEPRVIPRRHLEDCRGDCDGCLPCTEPHCRVCRRTHADGTCAECKAETREALHDIARMCGSLPAEVEARGVQSEAAMLWGPAADPEARGHLEASVLAGRVPADYLDAADGELHPLFVLGTWDMLWRDALEHSEPPGRLSVYEAVDYLDRQLTYMAGFEYVPFEDFARDLRQCRTHLEAVLHDGEQRDTGAPCMKCNTKLVRCWMGRELPWDGSDGKPAKAKADGWACSSCHTWHTEDQYRIAVRTDYERRGVIEADRLPADRLAERLGVSYSSVRRWASRPSQITEDAVIYYPAPLPACGIEGGRKVYRVSTAEDIKRGVCFWPRRGSLTQVAGL